MKIKLAVFILGFVFLLQSENLFAVNYEAYKIFLHGILSLKKWHISTAIENYEKVIALDKNAIAAYKDLIYLYWLSGNEKKVLQIIDKLNEFDGENFQTTNFLAVIYFTADNFDMAKQFWKKTIKLNPENKTAIVCLATYYNDAASAYCNFYLAQKKCEKYIPTCPDSMFKLAYLAECYYKINDYKKTEEILLKIRKKFPRSRMVTYWLGIIYEITGHIDKAIAEFEKFKKLTLKEERNIPVFKELGHCYSRLKDYQKSEKNLLKALDLNPLDIITLKLTTINYINWEKYGKVIEYSNRIIELVPNFVDFADAYFFLGYAYNKNKDFEKAEKAFLKAIKINPENSMAMNHLGHIYADKGIKLNEAEALLTKSITLKPKNGIYLDSLGWLYYKQGKFDDAERLLLSAANLTRYYLIYDHLGDTYTALGRIVEAWTAYASSYDFKQDKNVKKKLDFTQIKIPQEEVYRQMLLRSESNYIRIPSFKTGYKAKLNSKLLSKSIYIPFSYADGNIKIDFPDALIPGGCSISIKNKQTEILPKAIESKIPHILTNIISQVCKIFNDSFYKQFTGAKVVRNKNKLIYSKDNAELILNTDTALIERFSQNNITVHILKYDNLYGSKIPSKIEFSSSDMKIKGILEVTKISLLVNAEKE
ncbi:MAG: DUF3808 domain-containing protein [Endomicrobium sp.]|jgi:tetratricopeptide (TPR) repeat protein|nr:DUF3808 domain-containing protein [Endomicrobium sp.]